MLVLGIETSCDETAAALYDDKGGLLSHTVFTQIEQHARFKGVVPEIAARAHLEKLDFIITETLVKAGKSVRDIDAVAAAAGPGLIGGVIVGVMTAKALASSLSVPFLAVNHLEGHALAVKLTHPEVTFPYLLVLTSGGHCQLLEVLGVGSYRLLGQTIDDAAGEAFDKVAKMLDLGYPSGGALIEKLAKQGSQSRFAFPRPMKGKPNMDFSFSGLKTAVLYTIAHLTGEGEKLLSAEDKADICASFQAAVIDVFADRTRRALATFTTAYPQAKYLVTGGGVAANQALRTMLEDLAAEYGLTFCAPAAPFCTDNGAMIAYAGAERLKLNLIDGLDFRPRPRWALYEPEK